jgi:hypothetical protein
LGRNRYYYLFKDLASHEEKVYFLRAKSEAFINYKKYEAWALVQHGTRIKIFGCNRRGKLTSKKFNNHLENAETIPHLTVHDFPASNSAVEWGNRTHMNDTCAMMITAGQPQFLWAEAVCHDVWLCNHAPTHSLTKSKTLYKVAMGEKSNLSQLCE